jgi:UDP-N-acetyl-D-galactosamine dehydrogenase
VILAVPHRHYLAKGWACVKSLLKDGRGIVIDVKAKLPRERIPDGVRLWRL